MGREVPIDHRSIGGLQGEQVVARKGVPSQAWLGSAMTASSTTCNWLSIATMAEAKAEDPLGWLGASLGAAQDDCDWSQAENRDTPRTKPPNAPAVDRFKDASQSSIITPVAVKARRSSGSVMASISAWDLPASSA